MAKRKAMKQPQQDDEQQQVSEQAKQSASEGVTDSEEGSSGSGDSDDSAPEVSDKEEADSPDEDDFDKINVNFEFFDPKERDFHGLKALLHSYLDGQQYDSSGLIDTIIAQASVGTVVRTGEDEDPVAVMTVLNTQQHQQQEYMGQVKQYIMSKCEDAAIKGQISKAWDSQGTGLIINERLINSPPQLAPPLVQALFDEICWAAEDEPTQERKDYYKLKHYLLMTRVFSDPLGPAAAEQQQQNGAGPSSRSGKPPAGPKQQQQQQKKKHKGEQQKTAAGPVIVYVRPEDEYFHQQSTISFTFPVEGRAVGKDELQPMRLVLLLPASKVKAARSALDAVVGNMASQ
eukprot:GHRR01001096.1.p1 GENE.GHRR01001096.1~~GHRR01001096.1.p1  ORF type:complete len:345 (+),score=133.81 GHRR01001096.1:233-1267(+)